MDFALEGITGDETQLQDGGPLDALIAFYHAFNRRDLDAELWLNLGDDGLRKAAYRGG